MPDANDARALDPAVPLLRDAISADAEAIALLHADSWRRHYRGAYLDSYLDGDVLAERRSVWTERLGVPDDRRFTFVAEVGARLVGFAHTVPDDDPTWGALLDNLHVTSELKRHGIGSRLLAASARRLVATRPNQPLYLWVLDQNTAARSFYTALGGAPVESVVRAPIRDVAVERVAHRIVWRDPATCQPSRLER